MTTEKTFYVYILASKRNGTIYIGVTSDLEKRIWEHKHDVFKGFTKRHKVHLLVYYEDGGDALNAIQREKQMKRWNRVWKIRLIEKHNPRRKGFSLYLWNDVLLVLLSFPHVFSGNPGLGLLNSGFPAEAFGNNNVFVNC